MRAFTVEARSLQSARGIRDALFQFRPQLTGSDEEGYRISIELGEADSEILAVLNALEQHVTERAAGPARVELDGRGYMMHADTQSQEALRDEPTAAV